jgi:hypothetical protein
MHLSPGHTNTLTGACHCGAVQVELTTSRELQDLALRECQCSFCRRHGGRTVTDREGHVRIRALRDDVTFYSFATRRADFLLCRRCGVYVAALVTDGSGRFSTVNARLLTPELTQPPTPVVYDDETADARLARRQSGWTPTDLELS